MALESSVVALNTARGAYYPTLSLSAGLGSGYSGLNQIGTDSFFEYREAGFTESGEKVFVPVSGFNTFATKDWRDQLSDNLYQTLSLNLRIPLFNGWLTRTQVAQAKIGIESSTLDLQLQKNNLFKIIQQSYYDAVSALNQYKASDKKVKATEEAFKYAEQKYNVGMITTVEYNDAKKEFNNAQSELIQSKYDYVFKTTIIDFYMGRPLTLQR
jgi:outer membrane protein